MTEAFPVLHIDYGQLNIEKVLGQGSGSTVYRALLLGDEVVAVKKPQISSRADMALFHDEVKLLSRLNHPNIILLKAAGVQPPNYSMVLEYVARGSLFDVLHTEGMQVPLPLSLKLRLLSDISRAMEYLRAQDLVHGDLKSQNVLLSLDWRAKVSDLDSAEHASRLVPDLFSHRRPTRPSAGRGFGKPKPVGTPLWMAPEVMQKQPRSSKSDVYSFAVLANELLSQQLPYADTKGLLNTTELLTQIVSRSRRPLILWDAHHPDCPPALRPLIERCWAADPNDRPSFSEILAVVTTHSLSHPLVALPDVPPPSLAPSKPPTPSPTTSASPPSPTTTACSSSSAHAAEAAPFPVLCAVFESQGPRRFMEDRHVFRSPFGTVPHQHLFAVFDGHGGDHAAEFASRHIPAALLSDPEILTAPGQALSRSFDSAEKVFLEQAREFGWEDGTTALVALLRSRELWIANAGDCKAVLCHLEHRPTLAAPSCTSTCAQDSASTSTSTAGQPLDVDTRTAVAVALTEDHKAHRSDEQEAIRARGGFVKLFEDEKRWRAQGVLDVTRCIGDAPYKPFLTAEPDIIHHIVRPGEDEFIILASDGLWDVLAPQDAVNLVRDTARDPALCAKRLNMEAYERGSTDNVTAIVVFFREPATIERVF